MFRMMMMMMVMMIIIIIIIKNLYSAIMPLCGYRGDDDDKLLPMQNLLTYLLT